LVYKRKVHVLSKKKVHVDAADMVFLCFCIAEFGGYSFMKKTLINILSYEEYSSSYFIHHAYGSIYRATNKTNF
jgi:hypothetical protein